MPRHPNPVSGEPRNSRGRLQRPSAPDGYRVATFADVLNRHGLTMACIAASSLLTPGAWPLVANTTARASGNPLPYLVGLTALLLFFLYWSLRHSCSGVRQAQWIAYLLLISVVEEIAFRLVIPNLLTAMSPLLLAHVLSNLLFACIHYFTLRWRFVNCFATFLGGMGLSYLMARGDLVLVIMLHWLGTFINTPAPPSRDSDGAG